MFPVAPPFGPRIRAINVKKPVMIKRTVLLAPLLALVQIGGPVFAQSESPASRMRDTYAARYGVNPVEAASRLDRQRGAGRLRAEIEAVEPDTFAGMYVEHIPRFRVVARFKGNAKAIIARFKTDIPIEVEDAADSLKELRAIQVETYADLKAIGIESASQISERDGSVVFFVEDPAAAERMRGRLRHGSKIKLGKAQSLKRGGEAAVEGGRPLNSAGYQECTTGFVVYKTGLSNTSTRYLTTAGHCANTLNFNGISLPFVGEKYFAGPGAYYDYQWHSRGTFTSLTNEIYEGLSANLKITAVWPMANMNVGDFICKWGAVTGFTCGNITSLNYNSLGAGGFVRVDGGGVDLSSPGDSGGPWYYDAYGEAWGIHQTHPTDNDLDAVFMSVSRLSASSLAVLTAP